MAESKKSYVKKRRPGGELRRVFTVQEKVKIIHEIESGKSQTKVCREHKLQSSTVSKMFKDRVKILAANDHDLSDSKRLRGAAHKELEETLLEWMKLERSKNIPINGPMLQAKAEELSKEKGANSFKCSTGWLDRFKARHKVVFEKHRRKSAAGSKWIKKIWPEVRKDYQDSDIFAAGETGLFYRLTPDKTVEFCNEMCYGGKYAKERFTVMVCTNMTGYEKRKLLVVGKFLNPLSFKDVHSLPLLYTANPNALMTAEIMETQLRTWDAELCLKSRKVLLLVDNCAIHVDVPNLEFVKIVFLPTNAKSVMQPLGQGIVRALKTHYRKLFLLHLVECYEKKVNSVINILDAIRMINKAWCRVSRQTIWNAFFKAKLVVGDCLIDNNGTKDDCISLSEWLGAQNLHHFYQYCMGSIDAYVAVDDEILTMETAMEVNKRSWDRHRIVAHVNEAEQEDPLPYVELLPTAKEALHAIRLVSRYLESQKIIPSSVQEDALQVELWIEDVVCTQQRQTSGTSNAQGWQIPWFC